ncbi:cyclic nucleotide-binding domain protein [Bacteriovorax sp. BSW11_IV]|uniref:cyclic nucleotide-binding domain-containing protein n=1 Tax=Bacteriovorax sp. BSW11_IV TaxID=1353529 RepID=UPI00038A4EB2|nr:cyclic nucleotide-binding domain-containing protein [Bacteriovorax sp. BSW11_IV]EQC49477.1 cyclic nucleotide-binding domain protein [Bacteriovorax sp. BSW11_IV]
MNYETIKYPKDHIVCRQGDVDNDLYQVIDGELLVFVVEGTKVHPVATLKKNEFLGELSYFDHQKRSAFVVATTEVELLKIPVANSSEIFPKWLYHMACDITARIRKADELIQKHGLKRKKVDTINSLSIDEQRYFYNLTK